MLLSASRMPDVPNVWTDGRLFLDEGFCSVPGPSQTVQRAELWGVILALQSSGALHSGTVNLIVVRHVGRLLDGHSGSSPFELVNDVDLLLLIDRMLLRRRLDTVRITKVKGQADEGVVLDGRVLEQDWVGNSAADKADDFGRRRVGHAVIDARRNFSGFCGRWYPVTLRVRKLSLNCLFGGRNITWFDLCRPPGN